MKKLSSKTISLGTALAMGWALHANASITTVVSPANMNGWSFNTTDVSGAAPPVNPDTAQMVTGPGSPPLGVGSAQLGTSTGQGDGSAQLLEVLNTPLALSSLTSLSYSTYVTANNSQQFPYLKLFLSNGDAIYFEPPYQTPATGNPGLPNQGAPVLNQWQSWNALAGGWWADDPSFAGSGGDNVKSLAAYLALHPGVSIDTIRFAVGFASPDDNFNGYIDAFTIGTADQTTTFDFEPSPVPEPSTIIAGALLLLPFGFGAIRSLRKTTCGGLISHRD